MCMYDTVGSIKMSASVCRQPENTADFSENYPVPLKGVLTPMSIFMTVYQLKSNEAMLRELNMILFDCGESN